MGKAQFVLIILIICLFPIGVAARGGGHSRGSHSGGHISTHTGSSRSSSHSFSGHSRHSGSHSISGTHNNSSHVGKGKHGNSNKAVGVKRDKDGKIARDSSDKKEFMKQTGYPNGRQGYVVDHIVPLKRGGKDEPSNMQWQTKDAAKAKDKWE